MKRPITPVRHFCLHRAAVSLPHSLSLSLSLCACVVCCLLCVCVNLHTSSYFGTRKGSERGFRERADNYSTGARGGKRKKTKEMIVLNLPTAKERETFWKRRGGGKEQEEGGREEWGEQTWRIHETHAHLAQSCKTNSAVAVKESANDPLDSLGKQQRKEIEEKRRRKEEEERKRGKKGNEGSSIAKPGKSTAGVIAKRNRGKGEGEEEKRRRFLPSQQYHRFVEDRCLNTHTRTHTHTYKALSFFLFFIPSL